MQKQFVAFNRLLKCDNNHRNKNKSPAKIDKVQRKREIFPP